MLALSLVGLSLAKGSGLVIQLMELCQWWKGGHLAVRQWSDRVLLVSVMHQYPLQRNPSLR